MQEHGYGWLILNRLMDKVEYRLQVSGRNCLSLAADLSTAVDSEEIQQDVAQRFDQNLDQNQNLDQTRSQFSKPQDQGKSSSKDLH